MNPIAASKPQSTFDKMVDSVGSAEDTAVRGLSKAASFVADLYTDTFERHPLATLGASVAAAGAYTYATCSSQPAVCAAIAAAPFGL